MKLNPQPRSAGFGFRAPQRLPLSATRGEDPVRNELRRNRGRRHHCLVPLRAAISSTQRAEGLGNKPPSPDVLGTPHVLFGHPLLHVLHLSVSLFLNAPLRL